MAINIIFFYNCFHFLDWIKLPCMLGNPGNNNGHPRPLGNPAREKGSCHALAALVSVCIRCLYYFHVFGILSLLRYLLEVVTFVAVIVVSMVCWSSAKMFINDDDSSVMKHVT